MQETKIRDASSVITVRKDGPVPTVLMGQRGKTAAFMPNKFVFPGGAVDPIDADVKLVGEPNEICLNRLEKYSNINSLSCFLIYLHICFGPGHNVELFQSQYQYTHQPPQIYH